jgi:hypothetical protein
MACAIMLQRGNTLPNMLSARFERAAEAIIAGHYTCGVYFPNSPSEPISGGRAIAGGRMQ